MRKLAVGLLAAGSIMVAVPAHAQGFWFGGPGFGVGIGTGYGYNYGTYYSDAYVAPGWGAPAYASYAYTPVYRGYDEYASDPGLVYADYDEPALGSSTYANEPTYQRRYAFTTSVRSPRYSRAYVPTYRNSYAYAPSRARELSSNNPRVHSARVTSTWSAMHSETVDARSMRNDAQPSARIASSDRQLSSNKPRLHSARVTSTRSPMHSETVGAASMRNDAQPSERFQARRRFD